MSAKVKVIVCIVTVATAYALGRWSSPVKVETKTVTVEVEKKESDTDKNKAIHTVVVETRKPDGTMEKTTTTDTASYSDTKVTDDTSKSTETDKTITYNSSKVTVMATYGLSLSTGTTVWGGSVSRPLLGPVAFGLFGLSNGIVGAQLGLAF